MKDQAYSWTSQACPYHLVSASGLLTVHLDFFSMVDMKLLKKVHLLPKLSHQHVSRSIMIGKNIWRISSRVVDLNRP
jgi:hypothetical protein